MLVYDVTQRAKTSRDGTSANPTKSRPACTISRVKLKKAGWAGRLRGCDWRKGMRGNDGFHEQRADLEEVIHHLGAHAGGDRGAVLQAGAAVHLYQPHIQGLVHHKVIPKQLVTVGSGLQALLQMNMTTCSAAAALLLAHDSQLRVKCLMHSNLICRQHMLATPSTQIVPSRLHTTLFQAHIMLRWQKSTHMREINITSPSCLQCHLEGRTKPLLCVLSILAAPYAI